jgi:hypothetical protein
MKNEFACRSEKLSGTRKRDESLFSLLLEVERRLRTEDRNDQVDRLKRSKQKDRPALESQKFLPLLRVVEPIQEESKMQPQF